MKKYILTGGILMFLMTLSFGATSQTWTIHGIRVSRLDLGQDIANCYIVSSESREAYVIDPGGNARYILEYLKKERLKVLGYLVTHGHNDHIKGLPELVEEMPAPAGIHRDDVPLYTRRMGNSGPFDLFFEDEGEYGTGLLSFAVIHTPGHSPGSVCFFFKRAGLLFTGDTLFQNGTGRTDLDGGSATALESSLKKLAALPAESVVFPGHGGWTSIGALHPRARRF
jgi:hydroxyacylglutathione hydrolase